MDVIADFLTQIRNACQAGKKTLTVPHSQFKERLSHLLTQAGYLGPVKFSGQPPKKQIELELLYHQSQPLLSHISRLSRPGRRQYVPVDRFPYALSGKGLVIVSTSQGLMTDRQARQKGLGGELICQVW